jgi:hypothetical protein
MCAHNKRVTRIGFENGHSVWVHRDDHKPWETGPDMTLTFQRANRLVEGLRALHQLKPIVKPMQ